MEKQPRNINIKINLSLKDNPLARKVKNPQLKVRRPLNPLPPHLPEQQTYRLIEDPRKIDVQLQQPPSNIKHRQSQSSSNKKVKKVAADYLRMQEQRVLKNQGILSSNTSRNKIRSSIQQIYNQYKNEGSNSFLHRLKKRQWSDQKRKSISRQKSSQIKKSANKIKRNSLSAPKLKRPSFNQLRTQENKTPPKRKSSPKKTQPTNRTSFQKSNLTKVKQTNKISTKPSKPLLKPKLNKHKSKSKRKIPMMEDKVDYDDLMRELNEQPYLPPKFNNQKSQELLNYRLMSTSLQQIRSCFLTYLSMHQLKLHQAAILIQKNVRGLIARRLTMDLLNQLQSKNKETNGFIATKNNRFWDDNNNSIVKINQSELDMDQSQSKSQRSQSSNQIGQDLQNLSEQQRFKKDLKVISKQLNTVEDPQLLFTLQNFLAKVKHQSEMNQKIMLENMYLKQNMRTLLQESSQKQKQEDDSIVKKIIDSDFKAKTPASSRKQIKQLDNLSQDVSREIIEREMASQHQYFKVIQMRKRVIKELGMIQKQILQSNLKDRLSPTSLSKKIEFIEHREQLLQSHLSKDTQLFQNKKKLQQQLKTLQKLKALKDQGKQDQLQRLINQLIVRSESSKSLSLKLSQRSDPHHLQNSQHSQHSHLSQNSQFSQQNQQSWHQQQLSQSQHSQVSQNSLKSQNSQSVQDQKQVQDLQNSQEVAFQQKLEQGISNEAGNNCVIFTFEEQPNPQQQVPPNPQNNEFLEIQTSLSFVRNYLYAYKDYLVVKFQDFIREKLREASGVPHQRLLESYHLQEDMQYLALSKMKLSKRYYQHIYETFPREQIVPYLLMEQFNQTYRLLKQHSTQHKQVLQWENVHLQMLNDCLNQALQHQRAFGLLGIPPPWDPLNKCPQNIKFPKFEDLYKLMTCMIQKLMEWASTLCGFYPEVKEEQTGEVVVIGKEQQEYIKQTRMQVFLQRTTQESEWRFLFFGEQRTAIRLIVAQMIYQQLIQQHGLQLQGLELKRQIVLT